MGLKKGLIFTLISTIFSLMIQPDVPIYVLTVEVCGQVNPKADMDKDHDKVGSLFFQFSMTDS